MVGEIMKQAALAESDVQMFHFRDRDGMEIDCVLETPDRRLLAIEVKLAMSVNEADFRHLRAMRRYAHELAGNLARNRATRTA